MTKLDRRGFLGAGAALAGGLLLRFSVPLKADAPSESTRLNAYIHIGSDDVVTFYIHKAEMGQGTVTSLSMLLAEELECDWKSIRWEFPGVDPAFGPMQGVFGSMSIRTSWDSLRKAGASAREMLIAAAAQKWAVDQSQCRAENGFVVNGALRLSYGSLADAAGKLTPPASVALKDASAFKMIGTSPKRLDTPAKVDGSAKFGIDVRLPGMLYAVLQRCPVFGGKVAGFDAAKAKAVPGVKDVVAISNGVAVIADNTWSAMQGKRALSVHWDEGAMAQTSSQSIREMMIDLVSKPGAIARKEGDGAAALSGAARSLNAVYEAPYLAHAPMEPLSAVVQLSAERCDIWTGDWGVSGVQEDAVRITGLKPKQIQIHSLYGGGSFGRRGGGASEVVEVAKAIGGRVPVKLFWTREEDMRGDAYRPMYLHKLTAGLDEQGNLIAWQHRIVGQSILGNDPNWIMNGVDVTSVAGASNIPYGIPNILVDLHSPVLGVPAERWRSVGNSHNAFAVETFLDDVAHVAGRDPYQLRRALLAKDPRDKNMLLVAPDRMRPTLFAKFPRDRQVLELAADKAGWGTPLPPGRGRGLAVHYSFRTSVAYVAEVTVGSDGKVKVDRVVCAVDCGVAINPDVIRAQVEGGIGFGLGAILYGAISVKNGKVEQSNFNDYRVLRMNEMPKVEVHIVASSERPTGIGEPVVPPIGPAVSNAIFAATGKRVRTLPLRPRGA